jgi:hypothetical protein
MNPIDEIIEHLESAAEYKLDNSAEVKAMLSDKPDEVVDDLLRWANGTNDDEGPAVMHILSDAAKENSPFLVEAALYAYDDFLSVETSTADEDDRWGRIHWNASDMLMGCFDSMELGADGKRPSDSDFDLMIAAGYAAGAGVYMWSHGAKQYATKSDYVSAFSEILPYMDTVKKHSHQFLTLAMAAENAGLEVPLSSFVKATMYLERVCNGDEDQMDELIASRGGDALLIEAMADNPAQAIAEGVL